MANVLRSSEWSDLSILENIIEIKHMIWLQSGKAAFLWNAWPASELIHGVAVK